MLLELTDLKREFSEKNTLILYEVHQEKNLPLELTKLLVFPRKDEKQIEKNSWRPTVIIGSRYFSVFNFAEAKMLFYHIHSWVVIKLKSKYTINSFHLTVVIVFQCSIQKPSKHIKYT